MVASSIGHRLPKAIDADTIDLVSPKKAMPTGIIAESRQRADEFQRGGEIFARPARGADQRAEAGPRASEARTSHRACAAGREGLLAEHAVAKAVHQRGPGLRSARQEHRRDASPPRDDLPQADEGSPTPTLASPADAAAARFTGRIRRAAGKAEQALLREQQRRIEAPPDAGRCTAGWRTSPRGAANSAPTSARSPVLGVHGDLDRDRDDQRRPPRPGGTRGTAAAAPQAARSW